MDAPKPKQQPESKTRFVKRIWHWRKKCYLYAQDYGLKGFPIG